MKIDFEGRTWELDELGITNKQAEKIRAVTGLSVQAWMKTLGDTEAEAWVPRWDCLYWLMLQQNGQTGGAIEDVDYPVYRFIDAYLVALKAEKAAEPEAAEPDPTRPVADSAPSREPASLKASGRAAETTPDG